MNQTEIDFYMFKICDFFLKNQRISRYSIPIETLLEKFSIKLDSPDYCELLNELRASNLFHIQDINTENGDDLKVKFKSESRSLLLKYGNYYKYKNRITMNISEILDLLFEELKNDDLTVLGFLTSKNIERDEITVRKIIALIKISGLADVTVSETFSNTDALIKMNGMGFVKLENRKFSEIKNDVVPSSTIYNYNTTHGNNSSIITGNNNTQYIAINPDNISEISKILEKIIEITLNDTNIPYKEKLDICRNLELKKNEIENGNASASILKNLIDYGDKFSSIGGFLATLASSGTGQTIIDFLTLQLSV